MVGSEVQESGNPETRPQYGIREGKESGKLMSDLMWWSKRSRGLTFTVRHPEEPEVICIGQDKEIS